MPVALLVELHNLAPAESKLRDRIRSYFADFGRANDKAHWARGLVLREDGDLQIDERLVDLAVHRGKQETYVAAASEVFETLHSKLNMIAHFQEQEQVAAQLLASTHVGGTPLVAIRDLSETAKRLQAGSQALQSTVARMELGMAESLAPPAGTSAE